MIDDYKPIAPRDRWARTKLADNDSVHSLFMRTADLRDLPALRAVLHRAIFSPRRDPAQERVAEVNGEWFVACCLCGLIGELLYSVLHPQGKQPYFPNIDDMRIRDRREPHHKRRSQKRDEAYLFVAALRHSCCHPAMAAPLKEIRKHIPSMQALHSEGAADLALFLLDRAIRIDL